MTLLAEKKFHLFVFSVFFLLVSVFGNESIPIRHLITNFNIEEILFLYNSSDEFFRTPNTSIRITLFILGSSLLFISFVMRASTSLSNKKNISSIFNILLLIFFISIVVTENIYNISAILIILISTVFTIFFSTKRFNKYEMNLLLSYFIFFLYPFFTTTYHETSLSELDNYLRFMLAIPIYITLRELNISYNAVSFSFMFGCLFSGLVSILFFIDSGQSTRVYTSSTSIFGAISLVLLLLTISSKEYYFNQFKNHKNLFYVSIAMGLIAVFLSGSRSLLFPLIIFIIYLFFSKSELLRINKFVLSLLVISITSLILIFNLPIMNRIYNSYDSTYNYLTEGSQHYYLHQDSIVPRINIWKGSINIIKSNPIYGIGLNNYTVELDKQIRSKQIPPIKNNPDNPSAGMNHAHNQYLDVYVKTGLVGLLLLIYFIYSHYIFYKYKFSIKYNANNHISLLGNVALICFCIIMLFNTILAHQQLTLFMVFIMMTLSALKSNILWTEDSK